MNEPPKQPRYFRLLEKGEIIKEGDVYAVNDSMIILTSKACQIGQHQSDPSFTYFRPIICDEWVSYAERKPTKEDFEPSGEVQWLTDRGLSVCSHNHPWKQYGGPEYWRRITPPEQPKPKSAKVKVGSQELTVLANGEAVLSCGEVLSAESIDEFIKQRELVMKKD